jgi:hypothetical protein
MLLSQKMDPNDTVPAPPPSFSPSSGTPLPQSPINADKTFDEFDGFAIPLHELDFEDE